MTRREKTGRPPRGGKVDWFLVRPPFFTSLIFILCEIWLLFKIGSITLLEKQFIVDIDYKLLLRNSAEQKMTPED